MNILLLTLVDFLSLLRVDSDSTRRKFHDCKKILTKTGKRHIISKINENKTKKEGIHVKDHIIYNDIFNHKKDCSQKLSSRAYNHNQK